MIAQKISIIIPAYNEKNNIINTIEETKKVFNELNYRYEIIIIDDGSTDQTYEVVKEKYSFTGSNIIIKKYSPNQGKGYALKYGTKHAKGNLLLFMDADLDLHPRQVSRFLEIMKKNNADVVIGSKKSKNSRVRYSFKRKVFSNGYYYLTKLLFGLPIRDTQTGFKLFRREVLMNVIDQVTIKRYAFDLELLIILLKKGYKIVESPVEVTRSRTTGRIGLKDVFTIFRDTAFVFIRLFFKKAYR